MKSETVGAVIFAVAITAVVGTFVVGCCRIIWADCADLIAERRAKRQASSAPTRARLLPILQELEDYHGDSSTQPLRTFYESLPTDHGRAPTAEEGKNASIPD